MIYKLQLYVYLDEEKFEYRDFYCDISKITGFYIPDTEEDDELSINLFFGSELINVKQEKHITDYLLNEFVNKAIEK